MRVGLVFLWITLMVAPLIAEKKPRIAVASKTGLVAQERAEASIYHNKLGIHWAPIDGKLP